MKIVKTPVCSLEVFTIKEKNTMLIDSQQFGTEKVTISLNKSQVKKLKFFIDTFVLDTKKKGAKK